MNWLRATALGVCVLVLSSFTAAQATVNEALELYAFWVDGTTGCDCNPGTEALPFKTIGYAASQAVANNHIGEGTHVWVQNGTYRETISLSGSSADTTWPITIEAVNHGQVTVSGSVLYTGWTEYKDNSDIYTTAWTNTWGLCATVVGCPTSSYPQPGIMLRQELIAVNGTVLTEVLSVGQMQPGTFYPDTKNKTLYLWPPSGTDMSTATVEVATNPTILTLSGKSNFVVRGLVFQYANSCISNSAVLVTGNTVFPPTNVLFDSDTFQWNNGQGFAIGYPTTYFTVENSTSVHNGDSGLQSTDTQYGLWQNDFSGYNNWRGAQGAYYSCNVAGFHPWAAHNDTLSGVTMQYNQAYGIHWDDDNVNISGSGIIASQNLLSGLFLEKDPGPIALSSSYACNSTSPVSASGLTIRNSEGVSFTNGVIYNNNGAQIGVIGQAGGIEVTDWLTGLTYNLITQSATITGNTIEGIGNSQDLFSDALLNGSDWTTFLIGFDSNNNTWWNASNSTTEFVVPVPLISTAESFAGWQLTSLQDLNSKFEEPSGDPETACTVTADADDYWIVPASNPMTLNEAGAATLSLSVMPLLNFDGTVNFTLDGISEVKGLSAANPTSVTGGSGSTTLTINAATSVVAGTYPITIIGNSGNQTHTVTVGLVVPSTSVRLSTQSMTFPSTQLNTTSAGQSFTLTNIGKKKVSITSITASANFAISSNNCGTSLKAGATCTITTTFTPPSIGTFIGAVTLVDGDVTSPQTVSLSGVGVGAPMVTLTPHSLSFGAVSVGTSDPSQNVTLSNTGQSALTLTGSSAITITGTDSGDFKQTNNCGTSVAAETSCTITVTFTPQASGSRSANVTIADNAAGSPQTVALNGSGAYPDVRLTPSTLTFGNVEVGYSSPQKSSILKNSGQVDLTISKVALSGSNPSAYTETNTCVGTFAPNASCTITVIFTPTASGQQDASITITDNTSAGSSTLNLTGSGALPTATLTPSSDDFGTVTVGKKSAAIVSTYTNTSSYVLKIASITISGTNKGNYSQTNTCPVGGTLAANASCTISVTFTPSASGTRTATVTATDNSSSGSHTISLTGTGSN